MYLGSESKSGSSSPTRAWRTFWTAGQWHAPEPSPIWGAHELALSPHTIALGFPRPGARECGRAGVVSALLDRITVYAVCMNANESSSPSLGKMVLAGL